MTHKVGSIYTHYKPKITEMLITCEEFNKILELPGLSFEKLLRIVSFGVFYYLRNKESELLRDMNLISEAWHQIVLYCQTVSQPTNKKYKRAMIQEVSNAILLKLRRRYTCESSQLVPIIENAKVAQLLLEYHHTSRSGNILLGKRFPASPEVTLKNIYSSQYGFYRYRLFALVKGYCERCFRCALIRPVPALMYQGKVVAGDIGYNEKPYSHISVDNLILGLVKGYSNNKFLTKKHALVVTCLFTNHVSILSLDNFCSYSVGLALKRL